jgi:hypothetical protein
VWDIDSHARKSLQWACGPEARYVADEPRTFRFQLERDFSPQLDFGWFKASVHGALEEALERFGGSLGLQDLDKQREPRSLARAIQGVALRIIAEKRPDEIRNISGFTQDWTTLYRDIKSAAQLIGVRLPGRGRPRKKSTK